VLDSVHLERMGIPSVVMVTQPFVAAAKATARTQGLPDLSLVVIPHDYLVEDDSQVRARIEPVVDAILRALYLSA
jgi:hypothetical protein